MRHSRATVCPGHPGDEALPEKLGRYRPCFRIASGGMATVYIARVEHPDGFGGVVALKTIHEHLAAHWELVDMFLDEANLASLIDHPNVCRVHDIGAQDGTYFLAMEYLLGESLADVIGALHRRRDAYLLEQLPYFAAAIIAQACDGLHAAHELRDRDGAWLGVVHRDVSPSNLFVGYDGRVKVVDFGLAKAARRLSQTRAGTVKGKLAYLAPESIRGATPDRRVDVWAAGVCLWELLTLERLFHRATDLETVVAVRDETPPPARSVAWWVPPQLDAIVLRALSRDPRQRFDTAQDMSRALRAFLFQSGVNVGSRDLAAWMADLFGEQRTHRLRTLEAALGEPLFEAGDAAEPRADTSGPSLLGRDDETPVRPQLRIAPEDLAPEHRRRRRRGPGMLAWVAVILLAILAGGGLATVLHPEPEPELSAAQER